MHAWYHVCLPADQRATSWQVLMPRPELIGAITSGCRVPRVITESPKTPKGKKEKGTHSLPSDPIMLDPIPTFRPGAVIT